MKLSARYGSHLPVLLQALALTDGPVLELGMGVTSTPILSAWCQLEGREVVSVENDVDISNWGENHYGANHHRIEYVESWDAAPIDRPWDVALIDHSPSERRVVEIRRLAHRAKYIIVHDTNGRYNREYRYDTIWPLFEHRLDFTALTPSTTILSNLVPLDDFWKFHIRWKTRSITF